MNIGDRVRTPKGVGEIVFIEGSNGPVLVEHDTTFDKGHDDRAGDGRETRWWFYSITDTEMIRPLSIEEKRLRNRI